MRRIPSSWLRGTAAVLAALLAGCAGEPTGSLSPLGALPPTVPRITGLERSAEREHARLIAAFGGEYQAAETQRVLADITARLVPATDRPDEAYQITILDAPVVNAFALPSGRLYVTHVETEVEGADAHFPALDPGVWREVAREGHPADDRHPFPFSYVTYERVLRP